MIDFFEILEASTQNNRLQLIFECEIDGIVPSVNSYWRHTRQGHHYISQKGRNFKEKLSWIARSKKAKISDKNLVFCVDWYCKKLCRGGDLDNRLKVLLDSLEGIVYEDDKQVVSILANKLLNAGEDKAVISVYEVKNV